MHYIPKFNVIKNEPLHVSSSSSAHHQVFTNCTLGTGVCHTVWRQLRRRSWDPTLPSWETVFKPYDIYQCQV